MENYNDHIKHYHENGNISLEEYYLNDELHRTGGPARIFYYENGKAESKFYYLNNKRHRLDGPAVIWYYENGNIVEEHYWLNDKYIKVNSLKEFKKYQKTLILK